jgi:hypothetical protein
VEGIPQIEAVAPELENFAAVGILGSPSVAPAAARESRSAEEQKAFVVEMVDLAG